MLSINPSDVIAALQACQAQLIAIGIALVIAIVLTVVVMKQPVTKKKLFRAQTWICFLLVFVVIINVVVSGPMNTMVSLALGGGQISDDSIEESQDTCLSIAEEGMVLLKNEGSALPLANGTKLNVFGWSSTNPVYGGTGSGSVSDAYDKVDIIEGLTDAGFEVNMDLVNFYTNYRATRPNVGMMGQDWTIVEPSIDDYNAAGIFESAKNFADTAVVVFARSGGEGADLPMSYDGPDTFSDDGSGMFGATGVRYSEYPEDIDASKSYLELTTRERAMLDKVTADYSNVVVVINAANTMELGFVEEYPSIKAAIWTAGAGQTGFEALGEILSGAVNPSGKTVDTYVRDFTLTPWYNNMGAFQYTNASDFLVEATMFSPESQPNFVNYVEGIYVGYKFYETAYAEAEAGNMTFDYDSIVQYPFGYGLSYTSFSQTMGDITEADGKISFDVTVTNTGSVAGKDVVEVYFNPPYTNGGIEKAAVNLVAFEKTGIIKPGDSETVKVSFNVEDLAAYDTYGHGCYVLEQGDYVISVNADSHTVLDSKTYSVAADVVYDESNPRSTDETVATNKMSDAEGEVTYLSRADGFANYDVATATPASYEMTAEQLASFVNLSNYPQGTTQDENAQMPTTGAKNGLELKDMAGLDYDDPKWDLLLDELTPADMDALVANGGYSTAPISTINNPGTTDCDGPASINNNFTGASSIGYPAATMIAATFNKDLAREFGKGIGKMADEMKVSGWYAPAMNIHRTAFAGRNFEYYSEDGVISGQMALNAALGAYEYKVYPYFKHFALNDQETNRTSMLCTWTSEQAAREIYLRAFEIAVKGSVANGVHAALMSSFNYIGTTWSGAYAPVQKQILRDEWGFDGMVLTDYFGGYGYMNATQAIYNGTDIMLSPMDIGINHPDMNTASDMQAARNASHDILYTVANSRAIASAGQMPEWLKVVITVDVIMAAIVILLEVITFKKYKKRCNEVEPTVEVNE